MKLGKPTAALMALALAVSMFSPPPFSKSARGGVDRYGCGGSTTVTETGVTARTWGDSGMTLSVSLTCTYVNSEGGTVRISAHAANNPTSEVSVLCPKPEGSLRLQYAEARHVAQRNRATWVGHTTTAEKQ